jgi:hypothetical protein
MNQTVASDDEEVNQLLGFGRRYREHRQGRPDKDEAVARRSNAARVLQQLTDSRKTDEFENAPASIRPVGVSDVQHGVTVGTLATIFAMDPTTVRKKLRDCAPIHKRKAGYVYDLKAAAQYLVRPVFDAEQYLKSMKPSELPTHLQEAYWSAMRKRQQWETEAGFLWRTEAVMEVFGDVFQTIKFAMQLWPDNVEQALGLSSEQRAMLIAMADALQTDIHKKLVQLPSLKKTPPLLAEGTGKEAKPAEMEEDYDLAADLV